MGPWKPAKATPPQSPLLIPGRKRGEASNNSSAVMSSSFYPSYCVKKNTLQHHLRFPKPSICLDRACCPLLILHTYSIYTVYVLGWMEARLFSPWMRGYFRSITPPSAPSYRIPMHLPARRKWPLLPSAGRLVAVLSQRCF